MNEYKITAVVETTISYFVSADSEEEARERADRAPDPAAQGQGQDLAEPVQEPGDTRRRTRGTARRAP